MIERLNEQPNKFQKWEIVEINYSENISHESIGFIVDMEQFPWNQQWEYSIFLYDFESVIEFMEPYIKSTGKFLSKKEINKVLNTISKKNKFDFYEIVEVINNSKPENIGERGHINGMVQLYTTGEWRYSISFLKVSKNKYGIGDLGEDDMISTGKFVPREDVMSNVSLKISTKGEVIDITATGPQSEEDELNLIELKNKFIKKKEQQ